MPILDKATTIDPRISEIKQLESTVKPPPKRHHDPQQTHILAGKRASSSEGNVDRLGAGSVAKAVIQLSAAAIELVATSSAVLAVAECYVGGSRQAIGVRSRETLGVAAVDGAGATTDILGPSAAVHNSGILRGALGEWIADESEVGVGGRDPVEDVLVGDLKTIE
ncbi:hypothetical protein V5O48_013923, partial [Marasmius crinis-equi]